ESELARFAEPLARAAAPGKKYYRLTPASLAQARQNGVSWGNLDAWFQQRAGQPASPAAALLFSASEQPPVELGRRLVLEVATGDVADGLMQWPATAALIERRLGPTALAVAEENASALAALLRELGIHLLSKDSAEARG